MASVSNPRISSVRGVPWRLVELGNRDDERGLVVSEKNSIDHYSDYHYSDDLRFVTATPIHRTSELAATTP
jgi:hypothetical protein